MGIKSATFFQLFDWNKKPRKKLFTNGTVSPEELKRDAKGKEEIEITNHLIESGDAEGHSGWKECSDASRASSITDEEVKGARPPGVIARLMGLDSLPRTGVSEPCSTPLNYYGEQFAEIDMGDKFIQKPLKIPSSPVGRFSTEVLPSRSAKPLSFPHHRLLSPIKNPSFSSGKDAAHIMEAAAKILEPGKAPSSELEEQEETSSTSTRYTGRTVSLAIQAKVNVRRREGLSASLEKHEDVKPTQPLKSQPISRNRVQKNGRSSSSTSNQQLKRVSYEDAKLGKNKNPRNIPRKEEPQGKSIPRRKRSTEETRICKNVQPGNAMHEPRRRGEESRRNVTEIVSFTFTSPMIRSAEGLQSNRSNNLSTVSGDALSDLLEKKLRELSEGLETAASFPEESCITQETVQEPEASSSLSDRLFSHGSAPEAAESVGECSAAGGKKSRQQHLSPLSVLEASFSSESCSSSSESCDDSGLGKIGRSMPLKPLRLLPLPPSQGCLSTFLSTGTKISSAGRRRPERSNSPEMDLSDSASSPAAASLAPPPPPSAEMEYVRRVVNQADLGAAATRSLDPRLFDLLEEEEATPATAGGKIQRKALFDCVAEWLDSRRICSLETGYRRWPAKGGGAAKDVAEQVGRDLAWWWGMGDWMVDELVAADMSSGLGRWLEFPAETFEAAAEMESSLLRNLVAEVFADI